MLESTRIEYSIYFIKKKIDFFLVFYNYISVVIVIINYKL
jgi:hypothetical protein